MAIDPNVPYDDLPTPPRLVRASLVHLQEQLDGSTGSSSGFFDDVIIVDQMPGADDYDKIAAAFTVARAEHKPVYFSPRTYLCRTSFRITGWTDFSLIGNGATLFAMDSVPLSGLYSFMTLEECHRFRVEYLHLNGNRNGRTGVLNGAFSSGTAHNWNLLGCTTGEFEGCRSHQSACDGWRVDAMPNDRDNGDKYPRHLTWNRCFGERNGRNGISFICGFDLTVFGGAYQLSNGIPPLSGVTLEPNAPNTVSPAIERVNFLSVAFLDNFHDGIHISTQGGRVDGVIIQNCRFVGNGGRAGLSGGGFQAHAPGVYIGGAGGCIISNCFFTLNLARTNRESRAMLIWITPTTDARRIQILGNRMRVPVVIGDAFYGSTQGGIIASTAASTSTNLSIIGNQMEYGGVDESALKIESAYALVTDNYIRGNSSSGLSLEITGDDSHIRDNFIFGAPVPAYIETEYDVVDTDTVTRTIVVNKVV